MADAKYGFTITACARWEGRYIVEWLNYYRLLGFDHVFLYCNDDSPEALYEIVLPFLLGPTPFVTFKHHPVQGEQYLMYLDFLQHHLDDCEWVGFVDIDEFIRLPEGKTIGEFIGAFGDTIDCMLFNWIFFGPNRHVTAPDGNVLENYTAREAMIHPLTKYVARSAAFLRDWIFDPRKRGTFWHTPKDRLIYGSKILNVLGEDMWHYYDEFETRAKKFINDPVRVNRILATAVVHHYAFRSERSFFERSERGLGADFGGQARWKSLAEGEHFRGYLNFICEVPDTSLAGFWQRVRNEGRLVTTRIGSRPRAAVDPVETLPDEQPDRRNIARGKPATQSSISEWSYGASVEDDAAGALNGRKDGQRKFHTAFEVNPWWQVDLGNPHVIKEIRIFNTTETGVGARFSRFKILVGFDLDDWVEVCRKEDDAPVGGIDSNPFIWKPEMSAFAQFVRITSLGTYFLHLDQVVILGR